MILRQQKENFERGELDKFSGKKKECHQNTKALKPTKNSNMTNKMKYEPLPNELEIIGKKIVDAAYTAHKNLGPGLLERVYEI